MSEQPVDDSCMVCCKDKAWQLTLDGLQMALPDVPGGDVAFASAEVKCAPARSLPHDDS